MGALLGGGNQAPLPPIQREPQVTNAEAQAQSAADSEARAAARAKKRSLASGQRTSLISGVLEDERILS
jgi:hypothetical protein